MKNNISAWAFRLQPMLYMTKCTSTWCFFINTHHSMFGSSQSAEVAAPVAQKKTDANQYKVFLLISGTGEDTTHSLGDPVVFTKRHRHRKNSNSVPVKPRFTKSVYVTQFESTVTAEGLKLYLHSQINDSQLSIWMLVKKEQD